MYIISAGSLRWAGDQGIDYLLPEISDTICKSVQAVLRVTSGVNTQWVFPSSRKEELPPELLVVAPGARSSIRSR